MPYIEKTGVKSIKQQLYQWYHVMTDPRIDGFNGFACKQKIYKVLWQAQEYLEKMPSYAGEEEWLDEQKFDDAVNKIKGDFPNRWSD